MGCSNLVLNIMRDGFVAADDENRIGIQSIKLVGRFVGKRFGISE